MSLSRRVWATWLVAAALSVALLPAPAYATTRPAVSAPSALVMTMDGRVMWSKYPSQSRRVASTIKMLTALVVRENTSLDDTVVVAARAADTPDGVGLVRGQRFTVAELLRFMLVASANDAAEALAIHVGGSEAHFVAMMNAKAAQLGLSHTHAVDPHGLSKREHSTASDLSALARYLMRDPELRAIVLGRSVRVLRPSGTYVRVPATNKLLGHYVGIEGVKTGYTNPAGYCLVSAAKRGRFELVGVVLGASTLDGRFTQTRALLDWGFAHVTWRRLVAKDALCAYAVITSGTASSVPLYAAREASGVVITAGSGVTTSAIVPSVIRAPIARGQQLGVLRISQRGVTLAHVALLAGSDVGSLPAAPPSTPAQGSADTSGESAGVLLGRLWAALVSGARWLVPAAPTLTLGIGSLR